MGNIYKYSAGNVTHDSEGGYKYPSPTHCTSDDRYYWIGNVLGGTHEFGDYAIMDMWNDNQIAACDYANDAEVICHVLNLEARLSVWGGD